MTLDGVFDHTEGIADEELHQHYTELLNNADVILYGRTTYQLMQYWQPLVKNPSGEKAMDDFAMAIDKIPKIVFSQELKDTGWESATLANGSIKDEVLKLRQSGATALIGSRSLILQLLKLHLIDEFQLCIYPVIAGKGQLLFEDIKERIMLKLNKTKTFSSGSVILYYEPNNE